MANGIKIGDLNISYFKVGGSDCSIYLGNTLVYPTSPSQTPCFAVVDDISDYTDTDFVDVYAKLTDKWYKLNNLNEYEEYGVYGEGRNITYYEGKLTIDGDYEYQYSGGSWVNIGEISGSTATLPNVPFTVNYNARNYNSTTKTFAKTSGQLADMDVTITTGTPTPHDTYVTVASGTRGVISGYGTYFNRTNSAPNLTIISKQRTDGDNCHLLSNRTGYGKYNWMYRPYSTKLTLHGTSEQGSLAVTTQPVIEGVRVDSNRLATYNNYTNDTTSTQSNFGYGSTNGDVALFAAYTDIQSDYFTGDFYWIYVSQTTLTDAQVQQVIAYNEGGSQIEYPEYYEEKQDPPTMVIFATMEEALAYACPYVGMSAYIDGVRYVFSGDSQSGYEWVIQKLPQGYTEVEYIENTSSAYINLGITPYGSTGNSFNVECTFSSYTQSNFAYLISCELSSSPYYGFFARYGGGVFGIGGGSVGIDTTVQAIDNGDGTSAFTFTSNSTSTSNNGTPITLFCGMQGTQPWRNGKGRLYSLTMTVNDTIIRKLVPCVRDIDNVAGAYDTINNVFYGSANSSRFVAGAPI